MKILFDISILIFQLYKEKDAKTQLSYEKYAAKGRTNQVLMGELNEHTSCEGRS